MCERLPKLHDLGSSAHFPKASYSKFLRDFRNCFYAECFFIDFRVFLFAIRSWRNFVCKGSVSRVSPGTLENTWELRSQVISTLKWFFYDIWENNTRNPTFSRISSAKIAYLVWIRNLQSILLISRAIKRWLFVRISEPTIKDPCDVSNIKISSKKNPNLGNFCKSRKYHRNQILNFQKFVETENFCVSKIINVDLGSRKILARSKLLIKKFPLVAKNLSQNILPIHFQAVGQ